MKRSLPFPGQDHIRSSFAPIGRIAAPLFFVLTGCETSPSTVELWIEPPAVYRFGSAEAAPLDLPEAPDQMVQVLAAALREAVAGSGTPERISVFAPYTGTRLVEPEYHLLQRAACEAGILEIDLSLIDPYDPDAPERSHDPAAAAPFTPPLCGTLPVVVRQGAELPKREFLPDPPD